MGSLISTRARRLRSDEAFWKYVMNSVPRPGYFAQQSGQSGQSGYSGPFTGYAVHTRWLPVVPLPAVIYSTSRGQSLFAKITDETASPFARRASSPRTPFPQIQRPASVFTPPVPRVSRGSAASRARSSTPSRPDNNMKGRLPPSRAPPAMPDQPWVPKPRQELGSTATSQKRASSAPPKLTADRLHVRTGALTEVPDKAHIFFRFQQKGVKSTTRYSDLAHYRIEYSFQPTGLQGIRRSPSTLLDYDEHGRAFVWKDEMSIIHGLNDCFAQTRCAGVQVEGIVAKKANGQQAVSFPKSGWHGERWQLTASNVAIQSNPSDNPFTPAEAGMSLGQAYGTALRSPLRKAGSNPNTTVLLKCWDERLGDRTSPSSWTDCKIGYLLCVRDPIELRLVWRTLPEDRCNVVFGDKAKAALELIWRSKCNGVRTHSTRTSICVKARIEGSSIEMERSGWIDADHALHWVKLGNVEYQAPENALRRNSKPPKVMKLLEAAPTTREAVQGGDNIPHGLINDGSTCYANVVIQCINAIRPLSDSLLLRGELATTLSNSDQDRRVEVHNALVDLLSQLRFNGHLASTQPLMEAMGKAGKRSRIYTSNTQEDSQEFAGDLLDILRQTVIGFEKRFTVKLSYTKQCDNPDCAWKVSGKYRPFSERTIDAALTLRHLQPCGES